MTGRQPLRSVRVPDHLWDAAKAAAEGRGESVNAAVNRMLMAYAGVDVADQPWVLRPDLVLAFGRVLAAAGALDTVDDAFYYVEKPYKWEDLHQVWVQLGSPWPPEPGRTSDRWDSFVARVSEE